MSERVKIIIAYAIICSVWGSTWLAIKIGLQMMPPFFSAAMRFSVAALVLLVLIGIQRVKIPMHREARWMYLVVTLFSFTVPFALVYWGQQFISSGLSSILFAAYPFSVALYSMIFLPEEKVTVPKMTGIIFGFIGIVVIFSNDINFSHPDAIWGMAAVLTSAMLQGFTVIALKKWGQDIHPYVSTFVPMAFSAAALCALSFLVEQVSATVLEPLAVGSVLYLGIFGSVLTFVSYFWLLKRVEGVILSLTSFVTPIIAVILGVIVLNENFAGRMFIGAALVLMGIITANMNDLRALARKKIS